MRKSIYQIIRIASLAIFLKTAAFSQVPAWSVNPAGFTNSMSLIAQVRLDGNELNGNANVLGAFVNNEVRGVATPTMIGAKAYYFLTIFSNSFSGETVDFKVLLSSSSSIHFAVEEVGFIKSKQIGDYPDGFTINITTANDFPVSLLPIPPNTSLVNYPFQVIGLNNFLVSLDNDPVVWSVANSPILSGVIGAGNLLTVIPTSATWVGTSQVLVTATETGTANAYSVSQYVSFTKTADYGPPVFGDIPGQFVQDDLPVPSGDLNEYMDFDGPCLEYSFEFVLPEGNVPTPNWVQPGSNSPSMNLVVQANFGGQVISGASHKLAGFVNGQLAGVASPQMVLGKELYFLTLANMGKGEIILKFYDADHQYMHEKASGINFFPATTEGNAVAPIVIDYAPIAIDLLPDGTWTSTVIDPYWIGEQHVLFFAKDCDYPDKIGSTEMVFLFAQCPALTVGLPSGSGLCFEANPEIVNVIWFKDGSQVGDGSFFAVFEQGSYHYEGASPTGCTNIKSCPIVVDGSNQLPPNTGPVPPGNWPSPPDCGVVQLTGITIDNSSPTALCKSKTVMLDNNGHASLLPGDVDDGSFTSCGTAVISLSQIDFYCQHYGLNQVVLTIEDAAGRTGTCTATVTVQDNMPPNVICKNHTANLNATGLATFVPTDLYQSGNDNCGTVNPATVFPSTFDCTDIGAHIVTLTVNDGHGNTETCTATVSVVDNVAPVAICPAPMPTVALGVDGNGTLPANIGNGSSTDNCSSTETSPSMDFACGDIGPHMVILTASDGTNSSTANCTFNVVDNVAPAANCTAQSVNAIFNANGGYTIDPDDLNDGSTDACGISALSATPATLNCQNEGPNTITLSVTDINSNTSTCTAVIDMAEFLTIVGATSTPDGCAGSGSGTITVTASAVGGQIGYSIDSGVNFQFNNTFSNLVQGTYIIVVKVFGIPNACEKTVTATVAPGNGQNTWYKDIDDDGYSDGITEVSCGAPSGYKPFAALLGPETDCNDNDPLQKPGQVWYPDSDNDSYGDTSSVTQCTRPSGYKAASELAGPEPDCNDNNAAINPGATEICNGIDDNCNGQIDEGASGGLTYVGNMTFSTQVALDDWSPCYSIIDGNVTITGTNINDLDPLVNLVTITGSLTIQSTYITKMEGLDNLDSLGGTLTIFSNSKLKNLNGLDSLSTVSGSLYMYYNFKLDECCAIYNLLDTSGVAGSTVIYFNKIGCNSIAEINSECAPPAPPLIGGPTIGTTHGQSIDVKEMTVFPNPAKGVFTVLIPEYFEVGELQVLDITGQPVMHTDIAAGQAAYRFDSGDLPAGIYLVCVKAVGQPTQVTRLVLK